MPADGQSAEARIKFLEGKCKNKNCSKLHPAGQKGCIKKQQPQQQQQQDAAPSAVSKGKSGGGKGDGKRDTSKGRGKGKDRKGGKGGGSNSGSRASSKGSGKGRKGAGSKKHLPCMKHNNGGCDKAEKDCPYAHRPATEEERAKFPKSKPRSSSPAARKAPCWGWFKDRSCKYGDSCKFSRGPKDAPSGARLTFLPGGGQFAGDRGCDIICD